MGGSGTGTPVTVSETGFTPAQIVAHLKIVYKATATGATERVTLIENNAKAAAAYVWNYCAWTFRHVVLDLVTVADQDYTTLPTGYCRVAEFGDWLVESVSGDVRPTYVAPAFFRQRTQSDVDNWLTDEVEHFTISQRGTSTPVVLWSPTPTTVKTYEGFQYFSVVPDFDETSTAMYFPEIGFDVLWKAVASRMCADDLGAGDEVGAPGSRGGAPSWRAIREMMEDARAELQYMPPSFEPHDATGDTQDMGLFQGNEDQVNSSGKLLMG